MHLNSCKMKVVVFLCSRGLNSTVMSMCVYDISLFFVVLCNYQKLPGIWNCCEIAGCPLYFLSVFVYFF